MTKKNTLFAATYHNNPSFVEMQLGCLRKYIKDSFDFVAFIDADETTKCLFSQTSALLEIKNECDRLGIEYIVLWSTQQEISIKLITQLPCVNTHVVMYTTLLQRLLKKWGVTGQLIYLVGVDRGF